MIKHLAQVIPVCNLLKENEQIYSLTKMNVKITILRDVMPCNLVEMYQRLGGACYPKFRIEE